MTKTWLITGASAGLGRIMTEKLLERGDHVIATIRRGGVLDDVRERHPEALQVLSLDVSDTAAVRRAVDGDRHVGLGPACLNRGVDEARGRHRLKLKLPRFGCVFAGLRDYGSVLAVSRVAS